MIRRLKRTVKEMGLVILEPYFCFWSRFYLKRWRPQVIVITGSVGKTQLLYLLKYQFGDLAYYSHKANTKIGIVCNMLNIDNIRAGQRWRWLTVILSLPVRTFIHPVKSEKFYLVEYDVARPDATHFFKWWLQPSACICLSVTPAHLQFFDKIAVKIKKPAFELAVESFVKLLKTAHSHIFIVEDNQVILQHLNEIDKLGIKLIRIPKINFKYQVTLEETSFQYRDTEYLFSQPIPPANGLNLAVMEAVVEYYNLKLRTDLRDCPQAPGRHSVLKGYKDCHLIDSTYNAQLAAMQAMFDMLELLPNKKKWLICGDMIEQGQWEAEAHQELAQAITKLNLDKLILVGRRWQKYHLKGLSPDMISTSVEQKLISTIKREIKGGEVILIKGCGQLYLLTEALLKNPQDKQLLHKHY